MQPSPNPLPEVAAAWQRAALECLWRSGIPTQAGRRMRSAAAVTLELVPYHPESMPAVLRSGPALQAAIGVPRTVTVRQSGRLALVDVPLPQALTRVRSLDRLPQAQGLALPIGWGPDGRAVVLDIANPSTPHGAILGATGSGKSNAVGLLLHQLLSGGAPGLRVLLADPDGRTFPGLPCAIDRADIAAALAWAAAEVERRASNTAVFGGPVVVFVDEVQDVCRNSANREALELVTARGRKHAVHAILSGRAVPRTVGENLRWRLAGAVVDYHSSMGAVGMVGAERLRLGSMLFQPGAVQLSVPEVDPAALQALAGSPAILSPWVTVPGPIPDPSPTVPEGVPPDVWGWLAGCAQDGGRLPGIGAIARRFSVGKARAQAWREAAGRWDGWSVGGNLVNRESTAHTPIRALVPEVAQ